MDQVFELYDNVSGEHISYHKTLLGALTGLSEFIKKETPGLVHAFGEDSSVDLSFTYSIKSLQVKD